MAWMGVTTSKKSYLFEVPMGEAELSGLLGKRKQLFGIFATKQHAIQWYTPLGKPLEVGTKLVSCCGPGAPSLKSVKKVIAK